MPGPKIGSAEDLLNEFAEEIQESSRPVRDAALDVVRKDLEAAFSKISGWVVSTNDGRLHVHLPSRDEVSVNIQVNSSGTVVLWAERWGDRVPDVVEKVQLKFRRAEGRYVGPKVVAPDGSVSYEAPVDAVARAFVPFARAAVKKT